MNYRFFFSDPLVLRFNSSNFLKKNTWKIGTKLIHIVLNSNHVPPSLRNTQTLRTCFSSRMRRFNIEAPNHFIDEVSKKWLACYPCRTCYSLSVGRFHSEITDHYNRQFLTSLFDLLVSQSSKYLLLCLKINNLINLNLPIVRLRYCLEGNRPSQTAFYKMFF